MRNGGAVHAKHTGLRMNAAVFERLRASECEREALRASLVQDNSPGRFRQRLIPSLVAALISSGDHRYEPVPSNLAARLSPGVSR
jgi:hypothetical protein